MARPSGGLRDRGEADRRRQHGVRDPERVHEQTSVLAELGAELVDLTCHLFGSRGSQTPVLLEKALVSLDAGERVEVAEASQYRPNLGVFTRFDGAAERFQCEVVDVGTGGGRSVIRDAIRPSKSCGSLTQSAVIPSWLSTQRSTQV